MTKTEQKAVRLTPLTVEQAKELGRIWGRIKPVSIADVFSECVRIVHYQEMQIVHQQETRKKTSKNPASNA